MPAAAFYAWTSGLASKLADFLSGGSGLFWCLSLATPSTVKSSVDDATSFSRRRYRLRLNDEPGPDGIAEQTS